MAILADTMAQREAWDFAMRFRIPAIILQTSSDKNAKSKISQNI